MSKHTPGPWRWELSESSKTLSLVGGIPLYDLTIIEPTRWGMGGATLMIRDTSHDGMNIMHKLNDRRDWIAPHNGREHHIKWCADVVHPDMRLIAAAPELLAALKQCLGMLELADCSTGYCCCGSPTDRHGISDGHGPVDAGDYHQGNAMDSARLAIAKAEAT